jgi:hypothetical protein
LTQICYWKCFMIHSMFLDWVFVECLMVWCTITITITKQN